MLPRTGDRELHSDPESHCVQGQLRFPSVLTVLSRSAFPSLLHLELWQPDMGRGAVLGALGDEMGFKQEKQMAEV